MIDLERQKENFKNHIATFSDYGKIKILDFKEPGSSHYRIRFLFEEEYYRLHISGDLGHLIASNYCNMCYDKFSDFVNNTGYFEQKIDCHDRPLYVYDYNKAVSDLEEYLEEYEFLPDFDGETQEEVRAEKIEEILKDFEGNNGLGRSAYDLLYDIDCDCCEWIDSIGKVETGILELYMLAFKLVQEQLKHLEFPGVVGQSAEMLVNGTWIKGKIVKGYRFNDGIVTIETEDGKQYWCGQDRTELYRKTERE